LNFEGLLTALLATILFHEAVARRVLAMFIMIIAGTLLSLGGGAVAIRLVPAAGVILACALWALDNNLTPRRESSRRLGARLASSSRSQVGTVVVRSEADAAGYCSNRANTSTQLAVSHWARLPDRPLSL
jgi:drug/metabolite transporter (DMT)-like permease